MKTWYAIALLVLVTFRWEPNTEPDISHYLLYHEYQGVRVQIGDPIPHPATTVTVDIPRATVANGYFVLRAVDTEGFDSEDSDQARCDTQACIDKYLLPGSTSNIRLSPDGTFP